MSILSRLRLVVRARLNDAIDDMEDPLHLVDQAITDLERSLQACRRQVTDARGSCRLLEHRLEQNRRERDLRQHDAKLAVDAGKDALAREALKRRLALDELEGSLEEQLEEARRMSDQLQSDLVVYEGKLQEAKLRRELLVTRTRAATLRRQVAEQTSRLEQIPEATIATGTFDEFTQAVVACEENLRRMQSTSEAVRGLVDHVPELAFERLRVDQAVENELRELKTTKAPPPAAKAKAPSRGKPRQSGKEG